LQLSDGLGGLLNGEKRLLDRPAICQVRVKRKKQLRRSQDQGNGESGKVREGSNITYDVNELTNRYASVGGGGDYGGRQGRCEKDRAATGAD